MKIGVGITTHNRLAVANNSIVKHINNLPPDAKLVIVDDASDIPFPNADYRFDTNVGIAKAKNKCLDLLQDCDHVFLFDDDTYPLVKDWWRPYVESEEHHLMYLFETWADGKPIDGDMIVYRDESIVAHTQHRGCMLYVDKKVLETVGGFDTSYGLAMHEHIDWSNRIYNAGLTTFPTMDVPNSSGLIHSGDEHREVYTSIPKEVRSHNLRQNTRYFDDHKNSSEFCEFRSNVSKNGKNVILTSYFTSGLDTQRGYTWEPSWDSMSNLIGSVNGKERLIVLNDCFPDDQYGTIETLKVQSHGNPYFMRWLAIYRYLRDHPEIDNVFCVDATDVEMLRSPFAEMMPGAIYSGDEESRVGSSWMVRMSKHPKVRTFVASHRNAPLLNCGILGGSRENVMSICRRMCTEYYGTKCVEIVDMALYNKIMHLEFASRINYGRQVNTIFKKYEQVSDAWWRHK